MVKKVDTSLINARVQDLVSITKDGLIFEKVLEDNVSPEKVISDAKSSLGLKEEDSLELVDLKSIQQKLEEAKIFERVLSDGKSLEDLILKSKKTLGLDESVLLKDTAEEEVKRINTLSNSFARLNGIIGILDQYSVLSEETMNKLLDVESELAVHMAELYDVTVEDLYDE